MVAGGARRLARSFQPQGPGSPPAGKPPRPPGLLSSRLAGEGEPVRPPARTPPRFPIAPLDGSTPLRFLRQFPAKFQRAPRDFHETQPGFRGGGSPSPGPGAPLLLAASHRGSPREAGSCDSRRCVLPPLPAGLSSPPPAPRGEGAERPARPLARLRVFLGLPSGGILVDRHVLVLWPPSFWLQAGAAAAAARMSHGAAAPGSILQRSSSSEGTQQVSEPVAASRAKQSKGGGVGGMHGLQQQVAGTGRGGGALGWLHFEKHLPPPPPPHRFEYFESKMLAGAFRLQRLALFLPEPAFLRNTFRDHFFPLGHP